MFILQYERRMWFLSVIDSVMDDKKPGRKRIIYKKLVERIGNVIKNNERITVAELASM